RDSRWAPADEEVATRCEALGHLRVDQLVDHDPRRRNSPREPEPSAERRQNHYEKTDRPRDGGVKLAYTDQKGASAGGRRLSRQAQPRGPPSRFGATQDRSLPAPRRQSRPPSRQQRRPGQPIGPRLPQERRHTARRHGRARAPARHIRPPDATSQPSIP